jgi:hypothetical protein
VIIQCVKNYKYQKEWHNATKPLLDLKITKGDSTINVILLARIGSANLYYSLSFLPSSSSISTRDNRGLVHQCHEYDDYSINSVTLETEAPEIAVAPAKAVTSATKGKSVTACSKHLYREQQHFMLIQFARNAFKNKIFCLLAISVARKRRNFVTDD